MTDSAVTFLYDTIGQHAKENGEKRHCQALIEKAKAVVSKLEQDFQMGLFESLRKI